MYGSIFRIKVKAGKEDQVLKQMDEWDTTRRPKVKGYVGSFIMMSDRKMDEIMGVAIFTSKTAYLSNAKDPEQDKWYKKLRANLKADPEWNDGEFVWSEYVGPKSHKVALH